MERLGSLDSFRCLLTKLHGIRPKIQLHLLQSHGFASQCFKEMIIQMTKYLYDNSEGNSYKAHYNSKYNLIQIHR